MENIIIIICPLCHRRFQTIHGYKIHSGEAHKVVNSSSMPDNRRHVTRTQLDLLAQYMERYPALALASARSREGHVQSRKLWDKIARCLNRADGCMSRSGRSWARYWIDLKFKIRRKYTVLRRCQAEGTPHSIRLSPIEQRIAKILTDEEGNLLSTAASYQNPTTKGKPQEDYGNYSEPETQLIRTELINVPEIDIKPNLSNLQEDPVQIGKKNLEDPIRIEKKGIEEPIGQEKKSIEDLKKELLEFELKKQKELFEIEKENRRERHKLEIEILKLKKQILLKELKRF